MSRAYLGGADLSGAYLGGADLSPANLVVANLSGANLVDANLSGAYLESATLTGARYQPAAGQQPVLDSIATAVGLSTLRYDQPRALVNLRKLFKDAGYREQERQITYALKHGEVLEKFMVLERFYWDEKKLWFVYALEVVDGGFNYLLFEFTTQWGMNPSRALWLVLVFAVLFAPAYRSALVRPAADGIWIVWNDDRRRQDLGSGTNDQGNNSPFEAPTDKPLTLNGSKAWRIAIYFSVLSAFNIGWRELNVGNWIARIQRYEFTYRATGWVRTVSGIQSLISVYLLAIWALTYFGRPFE